MSISDEIRDAVRAARATSETGPDDPFKQVLDEVAQGLTDELVQAGFTASPGGRWTLWLAPAYRPGRAVSMLSMAIFGDEARMLASKQVAKTPAELAKLLKEIVTKPEFIGSLQEIADLTKQPVEGFLRMAPHTVSREDIMLEVPPDTQRTIAEMAGQTVDLQLRIANFPGAGRFKSGTPYKVLESGGLSVVLSKDVEQEEDGALRLVGLAGPAPKE